MSEDRGYDWILAIDPGATTGYAIWSIGAGRVVGHGQKEQQKFLASADIWLEYNTPRVLVVYERFVITPTTSRKPESVAAIEAIGALKYLAGKHGVFELVSSPAASAKRFVTDERLKNCGMWFVGQEHARDAGRHLLLELVNRQLLDSKLRDAVMSVLDK